MQDVHNLEKDKNQVSMFAFIIQDSGERCKSYVIGKRKGRTV